jgi:hypothetical protein
MFDSSTSFPAEVLVFTPEMERRRQVRQLCDPRPLLNMLVRPNFTCLRAFVHDFCAGGLGLMVQRPLEPGDLVALQLRKGRHGVSCILTARVIHTTRCPRGGWLIGCQLSWPLLEDEP